MISEHEKMIKKLNMMENALRNYDWYQKDASIQASSIDSLMKKAIKYK